MSTKRIKKEIADLAKEDLGSIILTPNESNIFSWHAKLPGPAGSPYEGGVFDVDIRIPEDYPFSPPQLQFMTKVYHCNIASTGAICTVDLLKYAWSPALSLYKVILSLSSLLTDPNPADPLVPAIASEYKRNRKLHDDTAREWVRLYATPKVPIAAPAPPTTVTAPPRVRVVRRPNTSSSTSNRPAQIAGTRRTRHEASSTNAADTSDVDVVGSSASPAAQPSQARSRGQRAAKRSRVVNGSGATAAGASADDVIVIDE
ncbi:ubiquitin-conjugating enzyme/RWD-like protein [Naematelia encephala]|uniref:Ubiquitin-conjugating enzyme/RWD-like protein n=1 Tax=Naematelia encephala TaxID=71784 RepID=A0A1Y2B123_9TREE|nr:ubiquitin-conjugating enzyme/RWD-like protein [Naematelia encephala]